MSSVDMPINLEMLLDDINFPVTRVEIVAFAEAQGASQEALTLLSALPSKVYRNMQQINANLGMVDQLPGDENIWASGDAAEANTGTRSSF